MRRNCRLSSWSFFNLLDSSAVRRPLLASTGTHLMFSFSKTLKHTVNIALYQEGRTKEAWNTDLPAVNSVPASSAVARKSSNELCSVTDCKFRRPQSYPSFSSLVWSWSEGKTTPQDSSYQLYLYYKLHSCDSAVGTVRAVYKPINRRKTLDRSKYLLHREMCCHDNLHIVCVRERQREMYWWGNNCLTTNRT